MRDVFEHIQHLERSLLKSEIRLSPQKLDRLLSDGFIEIGQSGRLYNKYDIIAELTGTPQSTAKFFDFDVRALSDTLILAGYKSTNKGRTVQRHSLWEKTGAHWQILYHEAEAANG
jgi:hypothetical protein